MAGGREGDWECSGCNNRNYAFRSFCNRCKHPRLLVDANTPPNSKWLPRFGDWICTVCTNNNYASREECKKCGQPKEVSAMPAFALPGILPRMQGGLPPRINPFGTSTFQQPMSSGLNWSVPYASRNTDPLPAAPKDWRSGDWICNCGFHNYSSRSLCKKCNAAPPALGMKRLATDEPLHDWDRKRQNAGEETAMDQYMHSFSGFGHGFVGVQRAGASIAVPLSMQGAMQFPQGPTLFGKGARQWRDGDWMCSNCNNHNYASRKECNRWKSPSARLTPPSPRSCTAVCSSSSGSWPVNL